MNAEADSFLMDELWRSDIVESYFDLPSDAPTSTQRTVITPPTIQQNMLTAPPLEKTDSQWSPMSSGLITPQDSVGYWSVTPDRRRSGRFSLDSSGIYGQSNRWSLGTQLSNVSFTELPQANSSDEDKSLGDKIQDWSTVETSESLYDEDDSIFHPDDEIIVDPKESMEAPIKRASIGSRAPGQEWPLPDISKTTSTMERFPRVQPLTLSKPLPPEHPQKIDLPDESYSARTSYSVCSDGVSFKYPHFDPSSLPKVTNRRSFIESPPDMYNSDVSWPLTGSTNTSHNSLWPHEKSLPPTPSRSRGVSLTQSRRGVSGDDYRMSATYDTLRSMPVHNERPASWNPRADAEFDLNFDRAILGTSLARDHRLAQRREDEGVEEQQAHALESIFNTLKVTEPASNRSSMNGFRERKYDDYRTSLPPSIKEHVTEAQRHRQAMTRIINERSLNPAQFDTSPKHARYFVIKSYNEDDVHKSLKFNIWASTEIGNRRLDKAYRESSRSGPIYLFFSVNASGQFCGMARMMSPVDYATSSSVWTQTDKWKGRMDVRWIFVKDIPNSQLRHIRVWNNENKPVTNSRDTQELPPDAGLAMLRIFSDYPPKTSVILTNLVNAEMKAESDDHRKSLPSVEDYAPRHSVQSEEYRQPEVFNHRQSWQSSERDDRSHRSSQFDIQDYARDRQGPPHIPLNRRNTIGTVGPMGSTTRVVSSTTPTSGMRPHEAAYVAAPTRYHDNPSYRSVLANVGEQYHSSRYPPFHERPAHHGYDAEEVRYF